MAASAGLAYRADGTSVFVKAFGESPADDDFAAETEGLAVLREVGGITTPEVLRADRDALVLSVLRPRRDTEVFWEQLAQALARQHTATRHPRFGAPGQLAGASPTGQHLGGRRVRVLRSAPSAAIAR